MRTSFRHQSEAQPPNGPLTPATSPDTPSTCPATQSGLSLLTSWNVQLGYAPIALSAAIVLSTVVTASAATKSHKIAVHRSGPHAQAVVPRPAPLFSPSLSASALDSSTSIRGR